MPPNIDAYVVNYLYEKQKEENLLCRKKDYKDFICRLNYFNQMDESILIRTRNVING